MSTAITPPASMQPNIMTAAEARVYMRGWDLDKYVDSLGRCGCANNLIALRGGRAGCIECGGDVAIGKQIWQCYGCGTCRVWGLEWPLDFSTPRLNCVACARVMPHRFMLVTRKQCK